MTIHDDAQRELAILFQTSDNTLPKTDPEFWAFYSDFAFGETLAHSTLYRRDRLVY